MTRSGLSIMVVEDERIISLALSSLIRTLGHTVVACVPSGEEAIEAAARHSPDLVLMDIHLQGKLDGIQAAQSIRSAGGPPVAFTTAYTDPETRARALAAAPLDFLAKPVDAAQIQGLVDRLEQRQ